MPSPPDPYRRRSRPARPRSASTAASRPPTRSDGRPRHRSASPDATGASVDVRLDRPRPLLVVDGELDLSSADLLTAVVEHVTRVRGAGSGRGGGRWVDVDLRGVTFADSHGLAPVLDGPVRLVASSVAVQRVLRLLRELPEGGPDLERRGA